MLKFIFVALMVAVVMFLSGCTSLMSAREKFDKYLCQNAPALIGAANTKGDYKTADAIQAYCSLPAPGAL